MNKKQVNKAFTFYFIALFFIYFLSTLSATDIKFSAEKIDIKPVENKENIFQLSGNAKIGNEEFSIEADEITIQGKNSEKIEAKSNVVLTEQESGMIAEGFSLTYYRSSGRLQMSGNVEIKNSKENFVARSSYVEIAQENGPITLRASVRIFQDNLFARADLAIYNKKSNQLQLIGNTYLSQEGKIYRTDRTTINLKTKEVILEGGISGSMDDERIKLE